MNFQGSQATELINMYELLFTSYASHTADPMKACLILDVTCLFNIQSQTNNARMTIQIRINLKKISKPGHTRKIVPKQ